MELEDIDGASKGRWSKVKPLKQHIFTLLALLASLGIQMELESDIFTLLALLASLVVQTSFARHIDGARIRHIYFTCTTRFARSANSLRSAYRWSQKLIFSCATMQMELVNIDGARKDAQRCWGLPGQLRWPHVALLYLISYLKKWSQLKFNVFQPCAMLLKA